MLETSPFQLLTNFARVAGLKLFLVVDHHHGVLVGVVGNARLTRRFGAA